MAALALADPAVASIANVYIAQNEAGDGSGDSCANAEALTFFSTAGNWGAGAGQIGAGTTVHVCGNIAGSAGGTAFNFLGSGSSGNPITLIFETGASLTNANYWGSNTAGAIYIASRSWITVNCANGVVSNSGNGSGLANQAISNGIYVQGSTNITIQNCTVSDIYQHTSSTDTDSDAQSSAGINIQFSSDITIDGNSVDDAGPCIFIGYALGDANITITDNTVTRCNWGIAAGARTTSVSLTTLTITGNDISSAANWDTTTDTFHHNGIYLYASGSTTLSTVTIANNRIRDIAGGCGVGAGCATGLIYTARVGGTVDTVRIYNNILTEASVDGPSNGYIVPDGTNFTIANNTIVGNAKGACISATAFTVTSNDVIKNNICSTMSQGQIWGGSNANAYTISESNYNIFHSIGHATVKFGYNPAALYSTYASLALWTTGTTFDANSLTTDPQFNSGAYTLSVSSPARGAGENLTGLGIAGLSSDYVGVSRPSSGAWDIGAYAFNGSVGGPVRLRLRTP